MRDADALEPPGMSRVARRRKTRGADVIPSTQLYECEEITTGSVGSLGMAFDEGRGQLRNVM